MSDDEGERTEHHFCCLSSFLFQVTEPHPHRIHSADQPGPAYPPAIFCIFIISVFILSFYSTFEPNKMFFSLFLCNVLVHFSLRLADDKDINYISNRVIDICTAEPSFKKLFMCLLKRCSVGGKALIAATRMVTGLVLM